MTCDLCILCSRNANPYRAILRRRARASVIHSADNDWSEGERDKHRSTGSTNCCPQTGNRQRPSRAGATHNLTVEFANLALGPGSPHGASYRALTPRLRRATDSRNRAHGSPGTRETFPDHSGFAPENLTTLAHFSVSSATYFPNSAAEPVMSVAPILSNRSFAVGSARIALTVALSLLTISAGVFFGAPRPYHALAS